MGEAWVPLCAVGEPRAGPPTGQWRAHHRDRHPNGGARTTEKGGASGRCAQGLLNQLPSFSYVGADEHTSTSEIVLSTTIEKSKLLILASSLNIWRMPVY